MKLAYSAQERLEVESRQKAHTRQTLLETCKTIESDLDVTWVEVEEGNERVTTGVGQLLDALGVVRESTAVVTRRRIRPAPTPPASPPRRKS